LLLASIVGVMPKRENACAFVTLKSVICVNIISVEREIRLRHFKQCHS